MGGQEQVQNWSCDHPASTVVRKREDPRGDEGLHSLKLTCPLKRDYFSREHIFQPLIFRCEHVSFREG